MQRSNFVDYVKIYFTSGAGGRGIVHWRREKHVPLGGPDGGDGGRGGHIILRGNSQLWTLLDLKYRKFIKAENGENGKGQRMKGRDGKDEILEVPLGVVVYDADSGNIIGEISKNGQELIVAEGGRGGLGNWHFRTATNHTPDHAQPGEPGVQRTVVIELKLLADVGLVGFPNAGKSTLLSVVTAAKPEIADYPFTTLVPNLGIVKHRNYNSFVMADIPGIIEGASEGKGLGITFLRHIERNAVLLFLIPADAEKPAAQLKVLLNELQTYDQELLEKKRVIALTKTDLLTASQQKKILSKLPDGTIPISAVTQAGILELKDRLWELLSEEIEATTSETFALHQSLT